MEDTDLRFFKWLAAFYVFGFLFLSGVLVFGILRWLGVL